MFRFPDCLRSTTAIDATPRHRPMKPHGSHRRRRRWGWVPHAPVGAGLIDWSSKPPNELRRRARDELAADPGALLHRDVRVADGRLGGFHSLVATFKIRGSHVLAMPGKAFQSGAQTAGPLLEARLMRPSVSRAARLTSRDHRCIDRKILSGLRSRCTRPQRIDGSGPRNAWRTSEILQAVASAHRGGEQLVQ
jgi:hypothetical protein